MVFANGLIQMRFWYLILGLIFTFIGGWVLGSAYVMFDVGFGTGGFITPFASLGKTTQWRLWVWESFQRSKGIIQDSYSATVNSSTKCTIKHSILYRPFKQKIVHNPSLFNIFLCFTTQIRHWHINDRFLNWIVPVVSEIDIFDRKIL